MNQENIRGQKHVSIIINSVILLALFGIAFCSGWIMHKPYVQTEDVVITEPTAEFQTALNSSQTQAKDSKTEDSKTLESTNNASTTPPMTEGPFLASNKGTRYYPTECSSAQSIKEENRVYYQTEDEAKADGKTRSTSKTCDQYWN